VEKNLKKR